MKLNIKKSVNSSAEDLASETSGSLNKPIKSRLSGFGRQHRYVTLILALIIFASIGTYLLVGSHAQDAWTGTWENLGGQITAAPAAASWGPSNLQVFVRGTDQAVYEKAWNGSGWSGWTGLGGKTYFALSAVSLGPGNMNVFATGTDYQVYQNGWTGSGWTGWVPLGGRTFSAPSAAWDGHTLDLFVRGTDNQVYYKSWTAAGGWTGGWAGTGYYTVDAPAAASLGYGNMNVYIRGGDNAVYQLGWTGSSWIESPLGGATYSALAAAAVPGGLDVFARGTDNHVYYNTYNAAGWHGWTGIAGNTPFSPTAVSWGADRIDVFAAGTDYSLWHTVFGPITNSLGSSLPIGGSISAGQALYSPSYTYEAIMQPDGNFVVRRASDQVAVWATGTNGSGSNVVNFQSDGNLVVRPNGGPAAWAAGTNTYGADTLNMQDDGNLVLYQSGVRAVWSWMTGKLPPPPTVSLTTPSTANIGTRPQLTIAASISTTCTVNGAAAPTNGTVTEPEISDDTTYTLTCYGPGGSTSTSKTVASLAPIMSAPAPTVDPLAGVNVSDMGGIVADSHITLTQKEYDGKNWAGYVIAAQPNSYTLAQGTIRIPSVSCPSTVPRSNTTIWVGLDGANGTQSVEQAGVHIDCWGHHAPVYTTFTEMWTYIHQELEVHAPMQVRPGDTLTMKVWYDNNNKNFGLQLHNETLGNGSNAYVTRYAKCDADVWCQRRTAEWIVERPGYLSAGRQTLFPLTDFSPVTFSNAVASTSTSYTAYAFTDWKNFPNNLLSRPGGYRLTSVPQPLYEQTKSFTINQLGIGSTIVE